MTGDSKGISMASENYLTTKQAAQLLSWTPSRTQDLLEGLEKTGWAKQEAIRTPGRSRHRWTIKPKIFLEHPAESAERR
jgi:hypothetical protein